MSLQTQYVPVELGGQLDEKTDQRLVIPGNFLNLENTVYTKTGSIRKRPGNDLVSRTVYGASSLPAARSLVGYDDSLLMWGNHNLYALSNSESTWYDKGQIPEPTVTQQIVASTKPPTPTGTTPSRGDHWLTCAKANGVTVYLRQNAAGDAVYSTCVDDNGNIIFDNTQVNSVLLTVNNPRIAVVGNFIIAMYSTTTKIYAHKLDTTIPSAGWAAATELTAGSPTGTTFNKYNRTQTWDACSLTDRFAIIFCSDNAGTQNVTVATFNTSFQLLDEDDFADVTNINAMTVSGSSSNNSIWIGWVSDNAANWYFRCRQYNVDLDTAGPSQPLTDTTTIDTGALAGGFANYRSRVGVVLQSGGTNCVFVCGKPADGTSNGIIVNSVTGSGTGSTGTPGANIIMRSFLTLVSKPFLLDSNYYVAVRDQTEQTYYLANLGLSDPTNLFMIPVATYADRQANSNDDLISGALYMGLLSDFVALSSTSVLIPGLTNFGDTLNVSGFTFSFDTQFTFTENNGVLCVSGGLPGSYGGAKFVENGFLQKPIITADSPATTAGATFPVGTYRYYAVYEWTDEKGQIFRSEPSDLYSYEVSGAAVGAINMVVSNIAFTRKQRDTTDPDPVRITFYRESPINSGTYKKLTFIANNPTTLTQDFSDDGTWNTDLTNTTTLIYTTAELPNFHPPTAKYILSHNKRVWLAGCDDETLIWPSKFVSQGESPNFSAAMAFYVPDGGAITGIASMDDKLVVFKKNKIYIIVGEGPTDLGTANDFQVQRVASDTGCVDGRSIVTTREGVFFQAPIGICMLTRALEVLYIGAPVEDTVNTYGTVTAAVNHTTEPWVLFSIGPSSSQGVVLHYDYYHRKWSKWLFYDTVASQASQFAKSLTMYEDGFAWVTSNGVPYKQSTTFLDNNTYVSMKVESAWLKFAGLVGFQRVKNLLLLGESKSAHNLTISLGHNYDASTYGQSTTFAYSVLTWPSEQFGVKLSQQKTSAVRFKLVDTQHSDGLGTGEGPILSGIGFEVGAKATLFGNLPITQGG